jgi:hypothetical protein
VCVILGSNCIPCIVVITRIVVIRSPSSFPRKREPRRRKGASVVLVAWVPAFAGMTVASGDDGGVWG